MKLKVRSETDLDRAAPLGFSYGDPYFDTALQVLELEDGALRGVGGRVCYSPAFAQSGGH